MTPIRRHPSAEALFKSSSTQIMGGRGLEPPSLTGPDPKSGASASFATRPILKIVTHPRLERGTPALKGLCSTR